MSLDVSVDSVRCLMNLYGLPIDCSYGIHKIMWGRDKNNNGTRAMQEAKSHRNHRCCKQVPQPEGAQPSSYLRAEATDFWEYGVLTTLKNDRKTPLLGQCPSVQHFYKGLYRTIYKRSAAFSTRHQHMRGEMS